jgi:DNA repair protein RadA/Sms
MKWSGKCDACNEWNTLTEELAQTPIPKGLNKKKGRSINFFSLQGEDSKSLKRHVIGINEFDRVSGGGIVPGSAILIGGDPGIGKSTLLLQIVCALAKKDRKCAYISGEEAIDQVRLRASRLGLQNAPVNLASSTNVRDIVASIEDKSNELDLVIIDSIQTMFIDNIDSAPGTVTQVRSSAQEIIRTAKSLGVSVVFVGHVTKDGQIAGPRVLEHMVDTVLYFEGDRSHHFRILRAVKNRFGPTDEIGVFEMANEGLIEVHNPSKMFLSQRQQDVAGSAVLAGLEGTRPLLVEVQSLVAPSGLATPRRAVIGWDHNRLAMILAVLESRTGLKFSGTDVFLNIAGGIRINEPAADLAVAVSLISSLNNIPVNANTVFFGEIGLSGEIRPVAQPDSRLKEASKLGFEKAVIPQVKSKTKSKNANMSVTYINHIDDLVEMFKSKSTKVRYAQA